jgi:hypothetical protein
VYAAAPTTGARVSGLTEDPEPTTFPANTCLRAMREKSDQKTKSEGKTRTNFWMLLFFNELTDPFRNAHQCSLDIHFNFDIAWRMLLK